MQIIDEWTVQVRIRNSNIQYEHHALAFLNVLYALELLLFSYVSS